jgi:integrase
VKATPALLDALRAHFQAVELEGQVKQWVPEQRQLVFPNPVGRVTNHPTFLEDVWRPLLAKAGLTYRKYHSTRHTFATWLPEDGADIRWVQEQMGHASIEQTAGTYGHCQPDRHEAPVDADRYLGLPTGGSGEGASAEKRHPATRHHRNLGVRCNVPKF